MARRQFPRVILLSLAGMGALALVSCGSGSGGGDQSLAGTAVKEKTLSDFQYNKSDIVYGKPGTETEGMIVGGRRSQFEGQRQVVFGGEYEGKTFGTSKYKSKAWTGKKDYGRRSYAGNTDASRLKTSSVMQGESSRYAARQSSYAGRTVETPGYRTPAAREAGAAGVNRDTSNFADDRFPMPKIISQRDYQKRTMEETNRLIRGDN